MRTALHDTTHHARMCQQMQMFMSSERINSLGDCTVKGGVPDMRLAHFLIMRCRVHLCVDVHTETPVKKYDRGLPI